MSNEIYNLNIADHFPLISPAELKKKYPISEQLSQHIASSRSSITGILKHQDHRFLLICGPCSIHDIDAALEYAERLNLCRERYSDSLCIVMRVYFEKPRTTLGWKGLIVDPHLDGSYQIDEGIQEARRFLIEIAKMNLPAGTEVLDPIVPQYIADLISWAAIGARTTESQTHRDISSGLSMPVGFKNGTDGDLSKAVNAIQSAGHSHSFIGIDQEGRTCIFKTHGNRTGHIIMRGGFSGPNYYEENIEKAEQLLADIGTKPSILLDCSHANSGKDPSRQSRVFRAALDLRNNGRESVRGMMLESNLFEGAQAICPGKMRYGVSITDACIGWDETEQLIEKAAWSYSKEGA